MTHTPNHAFARIDIDTIENEQRFLPSPIMMQAIQTYLATSPYKRYRLSQHYLTNNTRIRQVQTEDRSETVAYYLTQKETIRTATHRNVLYATTIADHTQRKRKRAGFTKSTVTPRFQKTTKETERTISANEYDSMMRQYGIKASVSKMRTIIPISLHHGPHSFSVELNPDGDLKLEIDDIVDRTGAPVLTVFEIEFPHYLHLNQLALTDEQGILFPIGNRKMATLFSNYPDRIETFKDIVASYMGTEAEQLTLHVFFRGM